MVSDEYFKGLLKLLESILWFLMNIYRFIKTTIKYPRVPDEYFKGLLKLLESILGFLMSILKVY